MNIFLNGQTLATQAATLAVLLDEQGIDRSSVACAINGDFVARSQYQQAQLSEGCKVEVLSPMQGG